MNIKKYKIIYVLMKCVSYLEYNWNWKEKKNEKMLELGEWGI